jgi:hypothetical protein
MSEINHDFIPVIWSQLEVPVECPDPNTGYLQSHLYFLHHHVGSDALDLDMFQQDSYVAPTGVCYRSWCTSLVSGKFCRKGMMVMVFITSQMLWGMSSLALYIPWAGKAGPYLGTSLWLWLGVLDAIQGVGLGMILLQVSNNTF